MLKGVIIMQLELISSSSNPVHTVAQACWVCTHTKGRLPLSVSQKYKEALIRRVLDRGHLSVLRHVSFSFLIIETHRNMTHQMVLQ